MTPLDLVLDNLRRADARPRGSGPQWQARCPAHDDHAPSLSVTEAGDGTVLLKCHAGCPTEGVVGALGLSFPDLSSDGRPVQSQSEDWVSPGALDLYLDACHAALLSSDDAALARRYLRSRGIDGNLVRHYGLGFGVAHSDRRLDWLQGRIIIGASYRHVEGRAVPGIRCNKPDVRWLSAIGSRKRDAWWRVHDVDPARPVVAVEGPFDVLGVHDVSDGQGVAVLGKGNASTAALRALAARGVDRLLLGLDADATPEQWRTFVDAGADVGVEVVPVVGPERGDWADLLKLDEDDYWREASDALSTPPVAMERVCA